MMEYNAFEIGPALEQIRKDKKMTREDVSAVTGLSVSSIKQIEYGIRNLSMRALYLFMEAYECDANTLLLIYDRWNVRNAGCGEVSYVT